MYLNKLSSLFFSPTARNTYIVFFGNGMSAVLALIYTYLLINALSLEDFGYFSAIMSLILLSSDIADIGLGTSLSRFLPELKEKKHDVLSFLKTAFLTQLTIAAVVCLVFYLAAAWVAQILFHSPEYEFLIRIASIGMFGAIMGNFFQYAITALQKFTAVSFLSGASSALRLILFIPLLLLSAVNLTMVSILFSASLLLFSLLTLFILNPEFLYIPTRKDNLKKLLSFSYQIGIARAFTALSSRLDVLMLIGLTTAVETGIYSTAARLTAIYPLLTGSFAAVIAPRLAGMTDRRELRPFMTNVIMATVGLVGSIFMFILLADPLLTLLFGEKGKAAVSVFQLLLISMIFFVGSIPGVSIAVYYVKKPYILTVNSVIQVSVVALGNMILIPLYGRFGAAYSMIAAFGITLFLTTWMSFYHLKKHHAA